jgi:hypothetical protein
MSNFIEKKYKNQDKRTSILNGPSVNPGKKKINTEQWCGL